MISCVIFVSNSTVYYIFITKIITLIRPENRAFLEGVWKIGFDSPFPPLAWGKGAGG
jgi:hypothetical protein